MESVFFKIDEATAPVEESLRSAFADDSDIEVGDGTLLLTGLCAPDRVNTILDRVYDLAVGCHVEVTFGVDHQAVEPAPPAGDRPPPDPPSPE